MFTVVVEPKTDVTRGPFTIVTIEERKNLPNDIGARGRPIGSSKEALNVRCKNRMFRIRRRRSRPASARHLESTEPKCA
jgi:hypothetical protein